MATRADEDGYEEEEHEVVENVQLLEALVIELHADDEDEAAVTREVEVGGGVVGHHDGGDARVVEAHELGELEEEEGLADSSDAVEDGERVDDAGAFGVADEAVAEEEEDQVDPERG